MVIHVLPLSTLLLLSSTYTHSIHHVFHIRSYSRESCTCSRALFPGSLQQSCICITHISGADLSKPIGASAALPRIRYLTLAKQQPQTCAGYSVDMPACLFITSQDCSAHFLNYEVLISMLEYHGRNISATHSSHIIRTLASASYQHHLQL